MILCLSMIVRNEAARIERALASTLPHISSYCVVDTGSDDGTPALIRQFFHNYHIPGEVLRSEFVNFEYARNRALALARKRADWGYLLLMDADMELVVEDPRAFDKMTGPSYDVIQRAGTLYYANRRFVKWDQKGVYVGVTHEYLDVPSAGTLQGVHFIDHADGANRPNKYARDIELLLAGLKENPNNERYWFYLAQSYRDAGDWPRAAAAYKKRMGMGGYEEEAWNAHVNYANALRGSGDVGGFVHETLAAYSRRPQRAEPLYDLAKFYRENGQNAAAAMIAERGLSVPLPKDDQLFIDEYTYSSGLKTEFSIAAFYDPERRERGFQVCNELALSPAAHPFARDLARNNVFHYIEPLSKLAPSFSAKRIDWTPPEGWVAMNPSVCVHDGGVYTTIRTVNYKISPEGRYQIRGNDMGELSPENPIRTRNYLAKVDRDLNVLSVKPLDPISYVPQFASVLGYEDMRLFSVGGVLCFSATVRDMNPEGWCEQAYGCVSDGVVIRLLPKVRQHEKNWMPWVVGDTMKFVYSLGKLIDTGGVITECEGSPYAVDGLRGGSQVVPHGAGWLAVVHEARVKPDGQRYYNHRFVWMDIRGRLRKISRPFYLHGKQIEFVAGLAKLADGRYVLSYGVRDCEAWLATVSGADVDQVLWHD